jgi:hypothetical protein
MWRKHRDNRSKQQIIEDLNIEQLKEEFQKRELRSRITKMDEKAFKQKIFTAISAVGSFLVVTFLFSNYLTAAGKSPDLSAALSLVAGFFAAFLIMAISGIIKEFSIKSGIIEVSSKLEQKIEIVQTNIEESKKEVEKEISSLNHNISLAMQSIDNKISNVNQNQTLQQLAGSVRMGNTETRIYNIPPPENPEERKELRQTVAKGIKQIEEIAERDTEDVLEHAPTESLIRQQALE